jgi:hypothetical protein
MSSKQSSKRNSPVEEKKGVKTAKPFDLAAMKELQSMGRFRVVKSGNGTRVTTGVVNLYKRMQKSGYFQAIVYDFDHRLTGLQEDIDAFINEKGVTGTLSSSLGTVPIEKLYNLVLADKTGQATAEIKAEIKAANASRKPKAARQDVDRAFTMDLLFFSNIARRSTMAKEESEKESKSQKSSRNLSIQDRVEALEDGKVLNVTKVERSATGWKGIRAVKGTDNMKIFVDGQDKVVVSPSQLAKPGVIKNIVAFAVEQLSADQGDVEDALNKLNSDFSTKKVAKDAAKKEDTKRKQASSQAPKQRKPRAKKSS